MQGINDSNEVVSNPDELEQPISTQLGEMPLDFFVVDLETTSQYPNSTQICEIAALRVEDGKETEDYFSTLVRIDGPMPEETTAKNNITDEMLATAPSVSEALQAFIDFIGEDAVLVGHNIIGFDYKVLERVARKCGLELHCSATIDTLKLAKTAWPKRGRNGYSLDSLRETLGLEEEGGHRALKDCEDTLDVYMAIRNGAQNLTDDQHTEEKANAWIIVCPQGAEQDVDALGDSVLFIEYSQRKRKRDGSSNSPARPNNKKVPGIRGTVASGWLDEAGDMTEFSNQPWYQYRKRIGMVIVQDYWTPDSCKYLFDGLQYCKEFDLGKLDTSQATSMEGMFRGCTSVMQLFDADRFNVSNVTSTVDMFMNCLALRAVSLNGWETDQIKETDGMFAGTTAYVLADEKQEAFLSKICPFRTSNGIWVRA